MENYEDDESLKQTEEDGGVGEETNELIVPEIETEEIDLPFESFYFTTNSEGDNFYYDFNANLRPVTLCERYRLQIVEVQFRMTAWQINEDDYLKIQIDQTGGGKNVIDIKPSHDHLNSQLAYLLKDLSLCFEDDYEDVLFFQAGINDIFTYIHNDSEEETFTITILEMTNNFEILLSMPYFTEKINTTPFPPIVIEPESTYRFIRPWSLVNGDVIYLTATSLDHPVAHFKKFNSWNQRICVSRFFNGSTEQGYSVSLSSQQASSVVSFTALNSIHFQLLRIDGSFLKIQTPMIFEVQITPIQTFISRSFLASNLTNSLMKRDKALNINNNFFTRGGRKVNEKLKTTLIELQDEQNDAATQREQNEEIVAEQLKMVEEAIQNLVINFNETNIKNEDSNRENIKNYVEEKYKHQLDELTNYKKKIPKLITRSDVLTAKKLIEEKEKQIKLKKQLGKKIDDLRLSQLYTNSLDPDEERPQLLGEIRQFQNNSKDEIDDLKYKLEQSNKIIPKNIIQSYQQSMDDVDKLKKQVEKIKSTKITRLQQESYRKKIKLAEEKMYNLRFLTNLKIEINTPRLKNKVAQKILKNRYKMSQERNQKEFIKGVNVLKSEFSDNIDILRMSDLSNSGQPTASNLISNLLYSPSPYGNNLLRTNSVKQEISSSIRNMLINEFKKITPYNDWVGNVFRMLDIDAGDIEIPSNINFNSKKYTLAKVIGDKLRKVAEGADVGKLSKSQNEAVFNLSAWNSPKEKQQHSLKKIDISPTMPSGYDLNNVNDISPTMPSGYDLNNVNDISLTTPSNYGMDQTSNNEIKPPP